jgi:hypothetical protein
MIEGYLDCSSPWTYPAFESLLDLSAGPLPRYAVFRHQTDHGPRRGVSPISLSPR